MIKTIVYNGISDCKLAHIFECGQCFRWNVEGDAYVGVVGNYVCRATMEGDPTLKLEVSGGDEGFWSNYFDLDTDYSAIKSALMANAEAGVKGDEVLACAIESCYGIRILNQDSFETLISFIISQNNNIPRIKKCVEALAANYGECLGEVFGQVRYGFPSPAQLAAVPAGQLAALKFGYRSEYVPAAAKKFIEEGAPCTYEQTLSYLGIGPKVANCYMLFGAHRVDAFPIDTWVKHFMNDMYGFAESDIRGMSKFAEGRFGRYAGYAQQYLFYFYRDGAAMS